MSGYEAFCMIDEVFEALESFMGTLVFGIVGYIAVLVVLAVILVVELVRCRLM